MWKGFDLREKVQHFTAVTTLLPKIYQQFTSLSRTFQLALHKASARNRLERHMRKERTRNHMKEIRLLRYLNGT